jgi:hypothetical protein
MALLVQGKKMDNKLMMESLESSILETSLTVQDLSQRLRKKVNITKMENLARIINSLTRLIQQYQTLPGAKAPAGQEQTGDDLDWANPNL